MEMQYEDEPVRYGDKIPSMQEKLSALGALIDKVQKNDVEARRQIPALVWELGTVTSRWVDAFVPVADQAEIQRWLREIFEGIDPPEPLDPPVPVGAAPGGGRKDPDPGRPPSPGTSAGPGGNCPRCGFSFVR